jgi:hypothetical protein
MMVDSLRVHSVVLDQATIAAIATGGVPPSANIWNNWWVFIHTLSVCPFEVAAATVVVVVYVCVCVCARGGTSFQSVYMHSGPHADK